MDRRAFLEGFCASVAVSRLKSPSNDEAPAQTGVKPASENLGVGQSSPSGTSMSVAGEWRIRLDPADEGLSGNWFHDGNSFVDRISLPGSTDEYHFGRQNSKPAAQHLTRMYEFTGPAWYEREIRIPESWRDKRVVLFLERCHWETMAWLDDRPLGTRNSLSAPHIFELGIVGERGFHRENPELVPGQHRLTVRVDNRTKVDVGESSAVTAEVGATWNGIVGRMELQTTDLVWIDRLFAYPDMRQKRVQVKLSMRNETGRRCPARLEVSALTKSHPDNELRTGTDVDLSDLPVSAIEHVLDLGSEPPMWDDFSPAIIRLEVSLRSENQQPKFFADAQATFGLRELAARGKQFRFNGNPFVFRGTVDNGTFPRTGYDPMDVPFWRERLKVYQDYGLNHVRFHSWCPPDAAFTAADELGLLFQVENPMWIADGRVSVDDKRTEFVRDEAYRIVDTYGNHPSFALMTMGNEEGSGQDDFLVELVSSLKERDPRHMYTTTSAPDNVHRPDNYFVSAGPQWTNLRGDPRLENDAPNTSVDYHPYIVQAGLDRPVIAHEVGQWSVFPNFHERKAYDGPLQPCYFEMYRDALTRTGLMTQAERFFESSGQLTVALYKEEIEAHLRTPDIAGFQLLGLTDFPGFGPAFVGILDTLGQSKGLIQPDGFRRFCGPTVPLLRLDKRLWLTGETLTARLEIAHYGSAALENAPVLWTMRKDGGATEASGKLLTTTVPSGTLTQLGTISIPLPDSPSAAQYTIECSVGKFSNAWDIWVYPQRVAASEAGVTLVHRWDASARAALQAGKTVVFLPGSYRFKKAVPCSFTTIFWASSLFRNRHETMGILCDPQHPALRQFPTKFHSDWQWWELTGRAQAFDLTDGPADLHSIVQIIDDARTSRRLGAVMEARAGRGKLLVTSFDLVSNLEDRLAARQLQSSLLHYAASPEFHPQNELQFEYLDSLLKSAET